MLAMLSCNAVRALMVGSQAPDFSLSDQDGKTRTLSEFKGKYVVLYFYPKDNTSGCTKQACQLRDNYDEFKKEAIIVLGINYDSPKTHREFSNKHHLPFILLSDAKKSVAKAYGAKRWWFLPFPCRMTFVIDPQGIVCSIVSNVDVTTHAKQVLELVKQDRRATEEQAMNPGGKKKVIKLVRDRIPEICKGKNWQATFRVADEAEYRQRLQDKLQEEVNEYLADVNLEELADVVEVVYALARLDGHSPEDLEKVRAEKAQKNGAFADRLIIEFEK